MSGRATYPSKYTFFFFFFFSNLHIIMNLQIFPCSNLLIKMEAVVGNLSPSLAAPPPPGSLWYDLISQRTWELQSSPVPVLVPLLLFSLPS
jgi:hypothetical protein